MVPGYRISTEAVDVYTADKRTRNQARLTVANACSLFKSAKPIADFVGSAKYNSTKELSLADALKVERAIYNLLLNGSQSARHGSGRPEIQVEASEDSEMVSISIADNGPGVPDSVRSTLFKPFVSEGKQSGTGLGLTIAQKVAQEHGGSVTLVESRPGRTVFRFSLAKSDLRRSPSSTRKLETSSVTD